MFTKSQKISISRNSSTCSARQDRDQTETVQSVPEALARFLTARKAFREKSIDRTDKAPHFACYACQDTGYVFSDGKAYRCRCYTQRQQERFMQHSGIPAYTRYEMWPAAKVYVDRFEQIRDSGKNWIAFFGRTGSGKSTQAYMIAESLIRRECPIRARVQHYSTMIRRLSAHRFEQEEFDKIFWELANDCDLFVLDDLFDTIPQPNSFEEQTAFALIKERYNSRKPMIITSELTPNDLLTHFTRGESLFGRIVEMCDSRIEAILAQGTNYRCGM